MNLFQISYVFQKDAWPGWADKDAWAPEMHWVNGNYLVYFSMRKRIDDQHAIGVAVSTNKSNPFGPYADLGHPIVQHPTGTIDVSWFRDPR